jgi:circadian clock protein KaiC
MKRVPTHSESLDRLLDGGVPRGHVVLLAGAPGTMKTSLAYSILHENARRGAKGLYVTLEQSRESLLEHVGGMGFDASSVKDALSVLDLATLRRKIGEGGPWMDLFRMYAQSVRTGFPYEILVLDSLDAFEVLAKFQDHRMELFELFRWLRGLACTSFVIGEMPPTRADDPLDAFGRHGEDYLADGIVHLRLDKRGDFEVQRRMRVVKMRGVHHDTGYHALVFDDGFRVTEILS